MNNNGRGYECKFFVSQYRNDKLLKDTVQVNDNV